MNFTSASFQSDKDRATISRETERLRAELRRVEQSKRKFVALTSNELRHPLAILMGYAKILEDESSGTAKEHAHIVVAQARQLEYLVDAISTLQQSDLGELALHLETLILKPIAQEVVARYQPELDERVVVANIAIDPNLNVRADRDRLGLILSNLIANAIKFSTRGGTIYLDARADEGEVIVRVRDQGVGIADTEQPRVFDRFYQPAETPARDQTGLGLGLAVVKTLVEAHRGRIWIESAPNQGSIFHFTLPRAFRENGNGDLGTRVSLAS